jgi:hypothetical protein
MVAKKLAVSVTQRAIVDDDDLAAWQVAVEGLDREQVQEVIITPHQADDANRGRSRLDGGRPKNSAAGPIEARPQELRPQCREQTCVPCLALTSSRDA